MEDDSFFMLLLSMLNIYVLLGFVPFLIEDFFLSWCLLVYIILVIAGVYNPPKFLQPKDTKSEKKEKKVKKIKGKHRY